MAKISKVFAEELLDSRGNPNVMAEIVLDDGTVAHGHAPSGASTGKYEAVELRDHDEGRFNGMGVLTAVRNVNEKIAPAIIGMDVNDFRAIDQKIIELDGTPNKANLGANATLAVSIAAATAAAKSAKIELFAYLSQFFGNTTGTYTLPIPYFNILNGGKHAVGSTDFQEFMIVPVKFPNFAEAYRAGAEIYHALGKILLERNYQPLVGDEGGFAPSLFSNEQAMELLMMATKEAKYLPGENVFIALDPAASRFYYKNVYQLHRENRTFTTDQLIDYYNVWIEKYPIISIEDGLDEDDWDGWNRFTAANGSKIDLIGDDLYTTNIERLKQGVAHNASNAVLIKPNQIGTLTETINAIAFAKQNNMKFMISHRSGENEDHFIADLAVAAGGGMIKSGAPCRAERTAKYNRILQIEKILAEKGKLAERNTSQNTGLQN